MDLTDQRLIDALRINGRASWAELGRMVGMSGPSVQDRVRRLEEQGVITGYTVVVDAPAIGRAVSALVDLYPSEGAEPQALVEQLRAMPDVEDCWHVAGDEEFLVKVRAPDVAGLQDVVSALRALRGVSRTRTTVVLSTFWEGRSKPVSDGELPDAATSDGVGLGGPGDEEAHVPDELPES